MAALCGKVNMQDVVSHYTAQIRIVGYRRFRLRLWFGLKLVRFGVWIMGMGCKVNTEAEEL